MRDARSSVAYPRVARVTGAGLVRVARMLQGERSRGGGAGHPVLQRLNLL